MEHGIEEVLTIISLSSVGRFGNLVKVTAARDLAHHRIRSELTDVTTCESLIALESLLLPEIIVVQLVSIMME